MKLLLLFVLLEVNFYFKKEPMMIILLILQSNFKQLVSADFMVESPRFKTQSAMIVAFKECNETYSNVFFDLIARKWHVYKYPTCLHTEKEVLSFCQRIYPKLNVVNVYQLEAVIRFNLYNCVISNSDERSCLSTPPMIKLVKPYKCLHGDFKEAKLSIPTGCQIEHLISKNECKSDDHWRLLSNEKCNAIGFNLNSSSLLQWCDAFTGGISTFSGIEFVCCPPSHSYFPTTKLTTSATSRSSTKKLSTDLSYISEEEDDEEEDIDDENDEYQDDSSIDSSEVDKHFETLKSKAKENEGAKSSSTQSNKVSYCCALKIHFDERNKSK
jgi:hypothetical protein